MLTKDAVLGMACKHETRRIKSAGGDAVIRILSGGERVRLSMTANRPDGLDAMLAFCLFLGDESGKRMFPDAEMSKADAIDGRIVQEVVEAGLIANGMTQQAEDEALGNSEPAAT